MASNADQANQASADAKEQAVKSTPKDVLVMAAILKEMGVQEYEPRVVNQMVEFAYRYVTDVIEDARVYSAHANRKNITLEDVKLSVSQRLERQHAAPPPREFLLEVARKKNSQPLPLPADRVGLRLPPERYCLTSSNFKAKTTTKKSASRKPAVNPKPATSMKPSNVPMQAPQPRLPGLQQPQHVFQAGSPVPNPSMSHNSAASNVRFPTAATNLMQPTTFGGAMKTDLPVSMLKRKHDEDDDYDM